MVTEKNVLVRHLGLTDYSLIYQRMQDFSNNRLPDSADEFWLLQHFPVYTLGRNSKPEHLLAPAEIQVVQADRGGQVTYHGPGQIIVYLMLDIRRNNFGVRQVVTAMESAIIDVLSQLGISAHPKVNAPGVYVAEKKIASLGLRIRNGKSYHGLALNVDMDLTPFTGINPCGYQGLQVTQVINEVPLASMGKTEEQLIAALMRQLNYKTAYKQAVNE